MTSKITLARKLKEELSEQNSRAGAVSNIPLLLETHSQMKSNLSKKMIIDDFAEKRKNLKEIFADILLDAVSKKERLAEEKNELDNSVKKKAERVEELEQNRNNLLKKLVEMEKRDGGKTKTSFFKQIYSEIFGGVPTGADFGAIDQDSGSLTDRGIDISERENLREKRQASPQNQKPGKGFFKSISNIFKSGAPSKPTRNQEAPPMYGNVQVSGRSSVQGEPASQSLSKSMVHYTNTDNEFDVREDTGHGLQKI